MALFFLQNSSVAGFEYLANLIKVWESIMLRTYVCITESNMI